MCEQKKINSLNNVIVNEAALEEFVQLYWFMDAAKPLENEKLLQLSSPVDLFFSDRRGT